MKQDELATVLRIDRDVVAEAITQLLSAGLLTTNDSNRTYEIAYDSEQSYHASIELPEVATDQKGISFDRDITTEACLIRLLKARRIIERNSIAHELSPMIRHFRPTLEQLNNCIRRLCEK